ncbi:uncharacterized protein N7484_001270 [Penicillium longicatenatum]|uniref:uncharacterized protein n=1 Tax=Penicillium longicatenatum TaxID=1561947 RepID=UPI002546761A|nr:uncharacterized protein N7484_001270 [Penicillium longicatenatum]KAJ5657621.1 hypothetical protein N7484_001270 [Penicillium longicatenatum]KAJ5663305.1 hypothetical protein N7507_004036 [Penicillium longicatenatum]
MTKDDERYHLAPSNDDEESINGERLPTVPSPQQRWLKLHYIFLASGYALLVLLYVFLIVKPDHFFTSKQPTKLMHWSLATPFPSLHSAGALEYESRTLPVSIHNNPYAGKPRPELEAAWHYMFEHTNIRVTKEDLDYYNVTSLQMTDLNGNGGYYVGQMGLFHELHCLKRIRHYIYRRHYLANFTEEHLVEEEAHIDHCIELMRETILCRGDPTLSAFRWIDPSHHDEAHLTVDAPGYHTCVNWEKLRTWNNAQAVDPFEPGALVGPDE